MHSEMNIIVGNSYSRIQGLSKEEFEALKEYLSYTLGGKNAYFSKFQYRRVSLLGKMGDFPTGLIKDVKNLFPAAVLSDSRVVPVKLAKSSINLPEIIPYVDQILAVKAAVQYGRGIISMPTGTGKSLVIAMIAKEFRVKTLVIVPSLEIKKQLKASIDSDFVTVENIDSRSLKNLKDFGCLIIDEAHHSAAKTYRKLNKSVWNNIHHRFFLTATPFRNDPEEELLFKSIAGDIIFDISYKAAIDKGYIVPVDAFFIEMPKQHTDAYTYREVYNELVVNNANRNFAIADLMANIDASTLCLVREIEHGERLSELTGIPFVSGQDDESRDYIRQFNSGGIKQLIGTTGVLGEGIDTKPCEYVIIAGLGKAKSQFMQQIGRAVRRYEGKESAKVILIKDKSHKFLVRHFNTQAKILLDVFGIKPVRLDIGG